MAISPTPFINAGTQPATGQRSQLQEILDLIGSTGGQTLINAAGAGMAAYGQSQQHKADAAQNAAQFAANMGQRQLEGDRQDQGERAIAANNAQPLGESQSFAQRQALLNAILPQARNVRSTPGDAGVAAAMGNRTGGMRLPEGGLDPSMINRLFGDEATLSSLGQRARQVGQINPAGPVQDLGALFGEAGTATSQGVMDANSALGQDMDAKQAQQRALIMQAIDEDIKGEKQKKEEKSGGGNIFGKILKGIGFGASFIPGVGQIVAPIATGLGGLVNGDGLGSSLANAGLAALPAGLGKVAKGAGQVAQVAQAAQKYKVPQIAQAILGRR